MFWSKKRRARRSEEKADFAAGKPPEGLMPVEKWDKLQTTILAALKPYGDAWDAVLAALEAAEEPGGG